MVDSYFLVVKGGQSACATSSLEACLEKMRHRGRSDDHQATALLRGRFLEEHQQRLLECWSVGVLDSKQAFEERGEESDGKMER